MSRALQKAIVYELFAVVLAIVVAAVAVAESVTAGYLTGPWILFAVPLAIALVGFLRALFTRTNGGAASGDSGADDGATASEKADTSESPVDESEPHIFPPF